MDNYDKKWAYLGKGAGLIVLEGGAKQEGQVTDRVISISGWSL